MTSSTMKGVLMSTADKARNKAEETKGKAVGDEELQAEEEEDQAKGDLKQAGEKIKDVFKS